MPRNWSNVPSERLGVATAFLMHATVSGTLGAPAAGHQREHQRPAQAVLPQGHRLLNGDRGRARRRRRRAKAKRTPAHAPRVRQPDRTPLRAAVAMTARIRRPPNGTPFCCHMDEGAGAGPVDALAVDEQRAPAQRRLSLGWPGQVGDGQLPGRVRTGMPEVARGWLSRRGEAWRAVRR